MIRGIYIIVCYLWLIVYLCMMILLYVKNLKPYKPKYNKKFELDIPNDLNPSELSILMYQRITAQTFSAEIIRLIDEKVLLLKRINGVKYICRNEENTRTLTTAEEYTVNILLEVIGDGKRTKIDINDLYTKKKKCCDTLLNEYKIWSRIMRKENVKQRFYETKPYYIFIKRIFVFGLILLGVNFILKINYFMGFIIPALAVTLMFFFFRIYKRTKSANEEYHKWLAFKNYLTYIDNFDQEITNPLEYIIYGIILNVKGLEKKITKKNNITEIVDVMNKNILNAIFKGNRSI
ncbi:MAG TPA: DUF2207 domain-containing protein [Bacilli bacterium]|nr:DUF2207 domain-containing protein [Bacilli bacterium]